MATPAQRYLRAQPSQWTDLEPVPGFQFKHILYDRRDRTRGGGVARITMNRVERMNSLTAEVFEELNTAFGHANRDNSVGVTVLTHNGPHFGVGGDVAREATGVRGTFRLTDEVIRESKKPVIVAVLGLPHRREPSYSLHLRFHDRWRERDLRPERPARGQPRLGLPRRAGATISSISSPTVSPASGRGFEGVDMSLHYTENFMDMIVPNYERTPDKREAERAFFEKRVPDFWREEMVTQRNL